MRTRVGMQGLGWVAAVVLLTAGPVAAQVIPALGLCNRIPAVDVLGRPLKGSNGDAPSECSRVEIREVGGGIVAPDPATGQSDNGANPLQAEAYMGQGSILEDPGTFSVLLSDRLVVGVDYFARVFDCQAPYYSDSAAFTAPDPEQTSTEPTVEVVFGAAQRVDGEPDDDWDGDGVPDAMEQALGLSPYDSDSRGDGWDDLFVLQMGPEYLNPTEPNYIDVAIDPLAASVPYQLSWWTIPGIWYRLEHGTDLRVPEGFELVWDGAAPGDEMVLAGEDLSLPAGVTAGFFRVKALPYHEP